MRIDSVSVSVTVTRVPWSSPGSGGGGGAAFFPASPASGSGGLRTGTVPTSVMRFVSRTSFWAIAV